MAIDSYDALGRPLQKRQHFWQGSFWGPGYYIQHTYDLAGNVKTLTYPSGRTVNYSYDQAGRLSSSSGSLGGAPYTYADTINYNAAGQMIKERFGTNTSLYHRSHYNNRLQLVSTRLGDSATDEWSWNRGAFDFLYGTTAVASGNIFANDTDNNGNLRRQLTYVPLAGGGYVIPQRDDYTYDALNRISSFTEAQLDSGGQWTLNVASQSFGYDRFGNRQITGASGGVNNYNPIYDQATNRINGLGYDAAGNITSDPLTGGTMTYDPENRLLTATSGGGGSYVYNADGERVKRITGGQETWHIYGCGGELLAEYVAGAQPTAPQKEYGYRNGQLLVIAEPGSGGNLAWGKATSQSSTGWGGNSSRGVDGNTNGSWYDDSVTHTQFEHQPWWLVDLGSVQQIRTVKLWNRTDCCSERLSNFYVLVSDNPFSSTDLTTTINQAGVSSYYTAGQAGALTEIGVGRSGRYVRVQLAGDNYLSLAEVEVIAGTASGEGIKWLMTDHLGSTRMVIDQTGSLGGIRRHDFAPFGEELSAGVGIRSASIGYSGDSVRQKFTNKERDSETGLDYYGARYFASTQGRFTSADPIKIKLDRLFDPQRFNLYSYVRNSPLKFYDPDGRDIVIPPSFGKSLQIKEALVKIARRKTGREFLEKLNDANTVIKVTSGLPRKSKAGTEGGTTEAYGSAVVIIKRTGGTVTSVEAEVIVSFDRAEEDRKAGKKGDIPRSDEELVGHELTHIGNTLFNQNRDQEEEKVTGAIRAVLNEKTGISKTEAEKFVENIVKPKAEEEKKKEEKKKEEKKKEEEKEK